MGIFRRRDRSIGDPSWAAFFGSPTSAAGVQVTEESSLGLTAVWRATSLIAGVSAGLPLKTYRDVGDGSTQILRSFLDDPAGPLTPLPMTPYQWVETVMLHLLVHGNAYLMHVYGGAGQIVGLMPLHPRLVAVEPADVPGGKLFKVNVPGQAPLLLTGVDLTHVPALSSDGVKGLSPIGVARNALGSGIAGERAAGRMFSNGALLSGLVVPEDDLTEDEARIIKDGLDRKMAGLDHAGELALVNRRLNFQPWSMPAKDAQFLEQRQFSIAEVSRLYGVPRELLSDTGASSWGSGIQELVRGFLRFTLDPWLTRLEQRLSQLLPAPRYVKFDRKQLLQGSPQEELNLIVLQVDKGLMTTEEARAALGRPPLTPEQSEETPAEPAADPVETP